MEDRRAGTVSDFNEVNSCSNIIEDGTQQLIFVNRLAVKRLAEPRWRHSLRPGERVTFAKIGGPKSFWAAEVMREREEPPQDIWEEEEESGIGIETFPATSLNNAPVEPAVP